MRLPPGGAFPIPPYILCTDYWYFLGLDNSSTRARSRAGEADFECRRPGIPVLNMEILNAEKRHKEPDRSSPLERSSIFDPTDPWGLHPLEHAVLQRWGRGSINVRVMHFRPEGRPGVGPDLSEDPRPASPAHVPPAPMLANCSGGPECR